jgi:hypothetical protein
MRRRVRAGWSEWFRKGAFCWLIWLRKSMSTHHLSKLKTPKVGLYGYGFAVKVGLKDWEMLLHGPGGYVDIGRLDPRQLSSEEN